MISRVIPDIAASEAAAKRLNCNGSTKQLNLAKKRKYMNGIEDTTNSIQHISDDDLKNNIIEAYSKMKRAASSYIKNLLAPDELHSSFANIIDIHFWEFWNSRNLLYPNVQGNWSRFMEDYHSWQLGDDPEGDDNLTSSDKSSFFRLMSAFDIPAEYFLPPYDDVIFDERKPDHFPGCWIIYSHWTDNDNLSHDPSPIGKTFTFTSNLKLNAVVNITDLKEEYGYRTFTGNGAIEGYTTDQKKEIKISIGQDLKIKAIAYQESSEDWLVHSNFPLWQKQNEFYQHKDHIWQKSIDKLEERFCYFAEAAEI